MSTKSTVAYGKDFHLYKECLEEDCIYLKLENKPFEATNDRVTVAIPIIIWEVIRQHQAVEFTWADKTHEDILHYVEKEVDERIKRYQSAPNKKAQKFASLIGFIPFGAVDTPRSEQIERGVKHYQEVKDSQRQLKQAIDELKREDSSPKAEVTRGDRTGASNEST